MTSPTFLEDNGNSSAQSQPRSAPESAVGEAQPSGALASLLTRVEAAPGPDRGLDVAIWYALHDDREELWALSGLNAQRELHREATLRADVLRNPREYGWRPEDDSLTASIDAALALVERVLPDLGSQEGDGWEIRVSRGFRRTWTARISHPWNSDRNTSGYSSGWDHPTPALAVCAALLKALSTNAPTSPCEQSEQARPAQGEPK